MTIVESPAALEGRLLAWLATEEPDLRIGIVEGDEPYEFFRVDGATQLPDGTIAVVNGGTQEIRYFDGDGRYLHAGGRRGSGPGEFQTPQLVQPLGATGELLIWDMMANRFTLLDGGGATLRMVTPVAQVRTPQGWDGAGAVFVARGSAAAGLDTPDGVMANDFIYDGVYLDGGESVRIAEVTARIYHAQIHGQPWFRPIPFDPRPSAAAGPSGFYVTAGASPTIQVYTSDGRLVREIRVARAPERVRPADLDQFVQRELGRMQDEELRTAWRDHYAQMPAPTDLPVYGSLLLDDVGYLWAEHFRIDAAEAPTWSVFDPEGGLFGMIRTPAGVAVLHVAENSLIGHVRDDLGVEQVVRYRLDRDAGFH